MKWCHRHHARRPHLRSSRRRCAQRSCCHPASLFGSILAMFTEMNVLVPTAATVVFVTFSNLVVSKTCNNSNSFVAATVANKLKSKSSTLVQVGPEVQELLTFCGKVCTTPKGLPVQLSTTGLDHCPLSVSNTCTKPT